MIFAAGIGSRLVPYTQSIPKALVPVAGIPMIEILIRHLQLNGINDMIINVHHFGDQILEFLELKSNLGANIAISDEKEMLLDTGGGLKKAAWFFDDKLPFLIQNVDVMSDIRYQDMFDLHTGTTALATLAVSRRETSRYFLFDENMQLCGWENTKTGELKIVRPKALNLRRFAFSGIHIINPVIFDHMSEEGRFSIVDTYLRLAADYKIIGFEHNPVNWVDMGKPEELFKAEQILEKIKFSTRN